ncbi:Phosphoglycerate mutase family domain-containing protein [Pleurostoma richardsiae]|uniref:Phosphoglycerate mutase family domain-containing protein n=1 Tax=Pleurostoma richardsiae TaxID=41990 RepID=A0AA38R855_9PEZI|nr:Phosphoglycerate mutase family domain-containing protein [Pleurostoma richardsiae]
MAKPRLIILIRHAQSEGNKNREIHQTVPDHRVKLTPEGWLQAYDAGRRLRQMLRADDTIQFFTSPYRRTRETTEGILATLTADDPEPTPFKRNHIKVYEEPRLREQDFGNFQPCSAEMERMWQERADYGHFFYRIPNGESAADAYDRVSGFNESLWRQFGEDDFASVCVLVTHGLMSRVFLMKWYHFSVEYFEDLRNINHCEFLIMRKQEDSGKYILENNLRTWSALRRERERALKEKEKEKEKRANGNGNSNGNGTGKDDAKIANASSPVVPRRWGGCPNGCNHDKTFRIRSALADLVKRDGTTIHPSPSPSSKEQETSGTSGSQTAANTLSSSLSSRRSAARRLQSSKTTSAVDSCEETDAANGHPQIDITRAREEVVSSPDGTPSFISVDDRLRSQLKSPAAAPPLLHVGRDFGGTYSGHTSRAGSDADSSEDEQTRIRLAQLRIRGGAGKPEAGPPLQDASVNGNGTKVGGGRAMANRLGDGCECEHHDHDHDHDHDGGSDADLEDLDKAEKEERSMESSVY